MTFYQELQLNQAGSKSLLKNSKTMKEKLYHAFVYMVKIAVTMVFCFAFVTASSIILGKDNSIVGVVVLLCVMVFRNADLGIHTGHSTWLLALFFVIMTVCPHLANQLSPLPALLINIAALAVLILFGCHNPFMFNQSTLVLGYLLLYGYDVSGKSYMLRIAGMAAGAVLTCLVFYRNHKNRVFKRNMKAVIQEFDLFSSRTKWQLCQILCVPLVLCIAQLCNMPRAMWAGIAAMSAILPFMEDMQYSEYEIKLEPGDQIFVYTDGVPEATNAKDELFGTDRMTDLLNEYADETPDPLLIHVKAGIDEFVGDAPQFDDLTMLSLFYRGNQPQ